MVLVTVHLPILSPLAGKVFSFFQMNLFTPSKGGNRGTAVAASLVAEDHAELVKKQAAELEGLRRRLEQAELASLKTPQLMHEAVADFRGRGKLAS